MIHNTDILDLLDKIEEEVLILDDLVEEEDEILAYRKFKERIRSNNFKALIDNVNTSPSEVTNSKVSILSYENTLIFDGLIIAIILLLKPLIRLSVNLVSDHKDVLNESLYDYVFFNLNYKLDYIKLYSLLNFFSVNIDGFEVHHSHFHNRLGVTLKEKFKQSEWEYEMYVRSKKDKLLTETIEYLDINLVNAHNTIMQYTINWLNINFLHKVTVAHNLTSLNKLHQEIVTSLDSFINREFLERVFAKIKDSN